MKEDFYKFMEEHPELRFWQALRAFCEVDKIHIEKDGKLTDTFYFNEKTN